MHGIFLRRGGWPRLRSVFCAAGISSPVNIYPRLESGGVGEKIKNGVRGTPFFYLHFALMLLIRRLKFMTGFITMWDLCGTYLPELITDLQVTEHRM